jgi:vancomycin aglycone glucosyltransferase
MRALLSTIGSRGDVQPLLALATQLRRLGHEPRLCAPPDFAGLAEEHALPFTPVGPQVRNATADPATAVADMIKNQFTTLRTAAAGCDVIVGANQLQVAAPSVAEELGIRYVFADYSPIAFPSPHHLPPPMPGAQRDGDPATVWADERARRKAIFGPALSEHRTAAGLPPVTDVLAHILTDSPLLAADPTLAPWPGPGPMTQTGAWLPDDDRPLSPELTAFLDDGEPPVYFGFGSMAEPMATGAAMVDAARTLGRRAIVLRGWGELDAPNCLTITEANFQALFPRVAAVVHHGGAGTTTVAARARVPQVVIPHRYDQHYFAERVATLGIGTTGDLTDALTRALDPAVAAAARAFEVRGDGAEVAARYVSG